MRCFAEPFVIGVEDNRYLPHYAYENGAYGGFGHAIIDSFFTAKGYEYRYQALPVARLFSSFVAGKVDFKYPDNALWSADLKKGKSITYSHPVVASTDGVNVLPERKGRPLDDIKILATVRGFTAWNWIDRIESGHVIMGENPILSRVLKLALIGRVDGAYANIDVVQYVLKHELNQPGALTFDPGLPHTKTHYFLSSIKYPEVILEFNDWLKANGSLVTQLKRQFALSVE